MAVPPVRPTSCSTALIIGANHLWKFDVGKLWEIRKQACHQMSAGGLVYLVGRGINDDGMPGWVVGFQATWSGCVGVSRDDIMAHPVECQVTTQELLELYGQIPNLYAWKFEAVTRVRPPLWLPYRREHQTWINVIFDTIKPCTDYPFTVPRPVVELATTPQATTRQLVRSASADTSDAAESLFGSQGSHEFYMREELHLAGASHLAAEGEFAPVITIDSLRLVRQHSMQFMEVYGQKPIHRRICGPPVLVDSRCCPAGLGPHDGRRQYLCLASAGGRAQPFGEELGG